MKKLMVVLMVLSMATIANAAMTLSITGAPATMTVGQTVNLAITNTGDFVSGEGATIALVTGTGVLSGGVPEIPPAPDATLVFGLASATDGPTGGALINGMDGIMAGIDTFSSTGTGGTGAYIDQILFTFAGPTTIFLYNSPNNDFTGWIPMAGVNSVTITPEPMTLGLLGLGGLFLRRRSK